MKTQTKQVHWFFIISALSCLSLKTLAKLDQCQEGGGVHLEPFHICYFSLNNEKEFLEMQKFTSKINRWTGSPLSIQEYLTEGDSPEESFLKMVESGVRCDGLVISGHHTGAFGGKRSSGSLSVDFLEKLSCDPKYQGWFNQINSLWLMGCRTLGAGEIVIDDEESSADYHTRRVGAVLEEDHLEQSIADLNIEFSATLDQDNPLDSRYLRVFPGAVVFGWTKQAPGERAGSQYSIPFHIAHISKLTSDPPIFPLESPIKNTWKKSSATQYLSSLNSVLNGATECQQQAIQAWRDHGKVQDQDTEYGFYNPDLNAHQPLQTTHNSILKEVRLLDCLLKNSQGEEFLNTLNTILKNPIFIRYTYNSLLERLKRLNTEDPLFYAQTVQNLKHQSSLSDFIFKKLSDHNLGIIRKIDYLAFYEQIYGTSEKIRSTLLNKVQEHFSTTPGTEPSAIDYKATLLYSLAKHGYLNSEEGLILFEQAFKAPEVVLRRYAIQIVDWIGGAMALSILEQSINDDDFQVRRQTMLTLGRMQSWRTPQGLNQSSIWAMQKDGAGQEILDTTEAIWNKENTKQQIFSILEKGAEDPDHRIQREAIWAKGRVREIMYPRSSLSALAPF